MRLSAWISIEWAGRVLGNTPGKSIACHGAVNIYSAAEVNIFIFSQAGEYVRMEGDFCCRLDSGVIGHYPQSIDEVGLKEEAWPDWGLRWRKSYSETYHPCLRLPRPHHGGHFQRQKGPRQIRPSKKAAAPQEVHPEGPALVDRRRLRPDVGKLYGSTSTPSLPRHALGPSVTAHQLTCLST